MPETPETPESLPEPPPPPDLPPPLARPYRDPSGLARALTVLLAVVVVLCVGMLATRAAERSLVEQVRDDPASVTLQELEDSDTRVAAVAVLFLLASLATGVVFIVWVHRTYSNLPALGNRPLRFGTGWAVGSWFIPFFNFVRPLQIIQDVYRGSDPDAPANEPEWYRRPLSGLVGWWWAIWLAGVPFGLPVRGEQAESAESIDDILLANGLALAAAVVSAVTAVLAVLVVRRLTERHVERARRLGVTQP